MNKEETQLMKSIRENRQKKEESRDVSRETQRKIFGTKENFERSKSELIKSLKESIIFLKRKYKWID